MASTRIAIISEGVVTEVYFAERDSGTIFPGGVPSETANVGDLYDGTSFTSVEPLRSKEALRAYAAQKRWAVEMAGLIIGGIPVATDDRSKILIYGAGQRARASDAFTTRFKAADGALHMLTAADIIAIEDAVSAHVQKTFDVYGLIVDSIDADVVTKFSEIDFAAWPVSA